MSFEFARCTEMRLENNLYQCDIIFQIKFHFEMKYRERQEMQASMMIRMGERMESLLFEKTQFQNIFTNI